MVDGVMGEARRQVDKKWGFKTLPYSASLEVKASFIIAFLYLAIFFPFSFFRHDDWWILGNSVIHLPKDWSFLLKPTLYWGNGEVVWFFRPFFKFFTYVFYQFFGFFYYGWLTALFGLAGLTLWTGYRALLQLSGRGSAQAFLLFFLSAIPLHFGSLAWAGEGLMNIPQGLLLMFCTHFWFALSKEKTFSLFSANFWGAIATWFLALGFKESTVFHFFLLLAITWTEPQMQAKRDWKVWTKRFAFLSLFVAAYLVFRLGVLAINPSYKPTFSWLGAAQLISKFLSIPLLAVGGWVLLDAGNQPKRWRAWALAFGRRAPWLVYFGISLIVYVGQDFFSPGWWYLPSLFLALGVGLCQGEVNAKQGQGGWSFSTRFALGIVLFLSLTLGHLHRLGWWYWGEAQRTVHGVFVSADPHTEQVNFYLCEKDPAFHINRVVGDAESLRNQWRVIHGTNTAIVMLHCYNLDSSSASIEQKNQLAFKWEFPHLTPLGPNSNRVLQNP